MKISAILICSGLLMVPGTLAGQCTKVGSKYRCGRIENNSKRTMSYTQDPNSSTAPHLCQFWNWPGHSDKPVKCTQYTTPPGGTAGCGTCSAKGVDVDGFTFADTDYIINNDPITKGVWTKIDDLTTVVCNGGQGSTKPYCTS
ncbi:hypothetical protein BCR34DRAFT_580183 [Clohesyomyces aquaticus]|uniref:Secreted protein n=1 Tax=Clohesyomyces aquaticus TaxID=1231657 RepID=A0A1Y1Y963_9PLEO|nr:hypothetical protein BCR34DRAFT_580183 [Clohesyomyces aquaticus]